MRWTIYEGEVWATFVRVTDPGAGDGTGRVKLMEGIIGVCVGHKVPAAQANRAAARRCPPAVVATGALKQTGSRAVFAKRRHRFRTRENQPPFGRSTSAQSGVALRFPPQSMTVSGRAAGLGWFWRLVAGYAIKCRLRRQFGWQRDVVHQRWVMTSQTQSRCFRQAAGVRN